MIVNNKLDKLFGPIGSFAGSVVFVAGLVTVYYSILSLFLVVVGAFVGFSYSSTIIDFDNKRLRFTNHFFGFIKTGQWINVKTDMKIGIKRSNQTWRSYSAGNRILDVSEKDFRLVLYSADGKAIMPIKITNNLNSAKSELDVLGKQLGLSTVM